MATHNIMAYRIFDEGRKVFIHDCDNDGESAAGPQLLRMLEVRKFHVLSCHVTVSAVSGTCDEWTCGCSETSICSAGQGVCMLCMQV